MDYSKAALAHFVDTVGQQGLVNSNTAGGWKAALVRILDDVADSDDVRKIDPQTAVKRYHNRNPGVLKLSSLKEYQRRLERMLADFGAYVDDPLSYKGRGRGPQVVNGTTKPIKAKSSKAENAKAPAAPGPMPRTPAPSATPGLSLEFPMRSDFLAQVVVPRDMKADEAKRLSRFIMTLAHDFQPKDGSE